MLYPPRRGQSYPDWVRLRRPRPESLLAWAATGVGAIGVVSALTPGFAHRFQIVDGVLPPGWVAAARVGSLTFGIALIWLSRSLALLAALLRYRRRFDVPGDPGATRPLLAVALVLAAAGSITLGVEVHGGELPDRLSDVFTAVGLLFGFAALFLWLRPLTHVVVQTVGEQRLARAIVDTYGRDSLAFFALRKDKSYFFSPTRRSFLAYRVVAGAALVSGDPVGAEEEFDGLLAEFRRVARTHGWRLAVLGASDANLERYRRLGMRAIAMGEEAVLHPDSFSLEGRAIRKVRQSVSRLTKAGYSLRVVAADEADEALRAQLDEVSEAWRGNQPERGFTMAIDDLYVPGTVFAIAEA